MPWVIGIDEAGYGPNLGPLVQAAVPLRLPEDDASGWESLRSVVRRTHEKDDGRLAIDDSKKVYAQGGLEVLELSLRAALGLLTPNVCDLIRAVGAPGVGEELAAEAWYDAEEATPVAADIESISTARAAFQRNRPADAFFGGPSAIVVPTPRFNRICKEFGSKAAVLSGGLIELVRKSLRELRPDGESVTVLCDKQGGRHFYGSMIQEAIPEGWVVAERESPEESRYRMELLKREVKVVFRPRADGDSAAVSLASMLCKYLREICMRQFNRYWAERVPGIKPTAGYPLDAKRFYSEIRSAMSGLGLAEEKVWRKK